jgi:hypothetical protein
MTLFRASTQRQAGYGIGHPLPQSEEYVPEGTRQCAKYDLEHIFGLCFDRDHREKREVDNVR